MQTFTGTGQEQIEKRQTLPLAEFLRNPGTGRD